jgi:uncharacterized membrane protein YqjE
MVNQLDTPELHPEANGPSMTALVSGIIADTQKLMRHELELARVEIKQELTKTRDAALSLAAGAGAMVWATVLLTLMIVFFINWATDGAVPLWGCFGIVGGLMLATGAILFFIGKSRAESINLVPPQTAETMQENVQWLKNPR